MTEPTEAARRWATSSAPVKPAADVRGRIGIPGSVVGLHRPPARPQRRPPATGGRVDGGAERSQEERLLFKRYLHAGDERAREQLIARFLPLARLLAWRYRRADEPLDDLVQVATLGMIKAVDRFDPDREVTFSTYAVPTILGELKRHLRDRTWSVRVPRDLQDLALKAEATVAMLSRDLRRSPSIAEISVALAAGEEQVRKALEAAEAYRATSLEAPRGTGEDDGQSLGDTLSTDEHGFALAEHRATLESLLKAITPREREVLRLRFEEEMTQSEIGELIGVSQLHVSRLIRRAVASLRAAADVGEVEPAQRRGPSRSGATGRCRGP